MKIAVLYGTLFQYGGVERIVATLVNELAKKHDVYLISTQPADVSKNYYKIDLDRIKIINIDLFNYGRNKELEKIDKIRRILFTLNIFSPIKNSKYIYRNSTKTKLVEMINEYQFDVVIGCSMRFNMLLGLVENQVNSKLIGWEHNSFDAYFNNRKINKYSNYKKIAANLLNRLDELVVLTKHDHEKIAREMRMKSTVIPNSIGIVSDKKSTLNHKQITIIGRLEEWKGTDLLAEIIKKFCSINKEWNFNVIGEGPMKSELSEFIIKNNLSDRIVIKEFTEQISNEYINSDIYISTSRFESFGLTVLEAMYHGLPIVTFDTAGPGELVQNNVVGYVIKNYDTNEFVEKLNILCTNEEIRSQMSKNAIVRSKDFSIEEVMIKWNTMMEMIK